MPTPDAPFPSTAAPLAGLTVLNPRATDEAPRLTRLLRQLGAQVLEQPLLAYGPPQDWAPFDARLADLRPGDWVLFSSAAAVRWVLERLAALHVPAQRLAQARLAAIGPATAQALSAAGLQAQVQPAHTFQAEGLLEALLPRLGAARRLWLPQAQEGRPTLAEGLRQAGHAVSVTPAYRTVPPPGGLAPLADALRAGHLDWLLLTSPSTVRHLLELLPPGARAALRPERPLVACLGQITAQAAREAGLIPTVVPQEQTQEGLVAALVAWVLSGARGGAGIDPATP